MDEESIKHHADAVKDAREMFEEGLLKKDLEQFKGIAEDASTLIKIVSIGRKLHGWRVQRNILVFFQEFAKNGISEEKRQSYLKKFRNDTKYRAAVLDVIMFNIEKLEDANQNKVMANLITSHVEGLLDFEEMKACIFALQRLNPAAYSYLADLAECDTPFVDLTARRDASEGLLFGAGIASRYGTHLAVSKIGKDLYEHGIKSILE